MKKESISMGVILTGLILVMMLISSFSNDDNTENTSATEGWNEYHSKSSSYSTSHSSGSSGNSGNRSSYWYDSPEVRKKKADDTLMKYYEYDENGNLTKKEGTIVNGKPYHKK